jgi:predicted phosphodiesterase
LRYEYKHFIPQNVAPYEAKKIGVYDASGKRICGIPLGRLTPPQGMKHYSFGLVSDTHLQPVSSNTASNRLENAMAWFESQGASFVCNSGDITNHGFKNSDGTTDLLQFADYKRIRDLYPNMPIYAACGNHDNYFTPITENLTELQTYTGHGLYFSVPYGNDLFVFIGQPTNSTPMNEEELSWLENLLITNADKRCFVFIHPYISDDCGNTLNTYGNALLPQTSSVTKRLKAALISHGKCIIFHGHSHFMQSEQKKDETTNYTNKNGFHSVHVPSLAAPAYVNTSGSREQTTEESYGYLVDVYDDCIVLNGMDLINNEYVPLGVYKIDATL